MALKTFYIAEAVASGMGHLQLQIVSQFLP